MADTPKGAEGAEEVGFDTEKALNKKGFAEFLAKHDDAEKGEVTQGDMESRVVIFGIQTEVAKDVQEVYKNEIFRDIGIRLDAADLACVSEFIEKRAVEAPGEVLAMQEQLKQFKELPEKIKQANNEILELAKTGEGFWGKTKMVGEYFWEGEAGKTYSAREKVEKTGVPLTREAIDVRIKWLATQVESSVKDFKSGNWVEGNEDLVTQFAKVKKSLFSHGQLREDMNRIAQEKLKAQLDILVNKGDLKSAEAGFKRMSGVKNDVETGLDYMTDGTEEEVKVALNHTSESYVYNKIENILTSMSLGSNAFANLERTYKQAVNTETVGDKDKSESIQFIIDTIESQVSALLETPANKTEIRAKKILARQLAAKLSKNK